MRQYKVTGAYIRNLRTNVQLTQAQFGKSIGIHAQFVSNCERGHCAIPLNALKALDRQYRKIGFSRRSYINAVQADAVVDIEQSLMKAFK